MNMSKNNLSNQVVTVSSSLGPVNRMVVNDLGDILLVCRQEEYDRAKAEGREPVTIGVRRSDMLVS